MRRFGIMPSNSLRLASMVAIRLCTKKTCPPRLISRMIASLITLASYSFTKVRTSSLSLGGVRSWEYCLMELSAILRLRGIGVALMERIWTFSRKFLSFSFCLTPNLCSSSTTTRAGLNSSTSKSECVPTHTCNAPLFSSFKMICFWAAVVKRSSCATLMLYLAKRDERLLKCWEHKRVVGAINRA